jgi:cytochrome c oxidase subunit 3
MAMWLFLAALAMLFLASLAGYLAVRLRAETWPPAGSPRLPAGLWISTLLLLVSSVTMHGALRGIRQGDAAALTRGLLLTLALGVAFLVSQVLNWSHLLTAHRLPMRANLYAFTFYLLTTLHGAHVLGGLVALLVAAQRARAGRYSSGSHAGVEYLSMYWHFLDAVWIVMFAVLMIAG